MVGDADHRVAKALGCPRPVQPTRARGRRQDLDPETKRSNRGHSPTLWPIRTRAYSRLRLPGVSEVVRARGLHQLKADLWAVMLVDENGHGKGCRSTGAATSSK